MALIEDHALIGDGRTAALVSRDGTIDWFCFPRFDSPACLASLLGTEANGFWRIGPEAPATTTRRYRGDTLVLETLFQTADGSIALIDFLDIAQPRLIRVVEGRGGATQCRFTLRPRLDYGRDTPALTADGPCVRIAPGLTLTGPIGLAPGDGEITGTFTIRAGERLTFALGARGSEPEAALAATEAHWRAWSARTAISGPWAGIARRSLLTLKALCHAASGGIIAAPTTSLPEQAGGPRNWDYRYCWPRDGSFSALAFAATAHPEEAVAWADWLALTVGDDPAGMRPVYGPAGEQPGAERTLPWLAGYEGARPVRIGNGAASQHQLDMVGAVALALDRAAASGDPAAHWPLRRAMAAHAAAVWRQDDDGIWEVRGGAQSFTWSKIMAWTALDRAIRAAERHGLPAPLDAFRAARAAIHAAVRARGFNRALGAFTQVLDGATLDASLLLAPLVGFLPPDDPRIVGTVEAIGRGLSVGALVKRYHTHETADGLPPGEGVFLACGFWRVAALAAMGRRTDAEGAFAGLVGLCNDVGLLAEEYDPVARRHMGNFPQGFSHLSLVWAALALEGVGVM
jgi:GH15 family glucan-1,4-alpha-glucosidase